MSDRFSGEINAPLCVDCLSPMFDDDEPDEHGRCSGCQDYEPEPRRRPPPGTGGGEG